MYFYVLFLFALLGSQSSFGAITTLTPVLYSPNVTSSPLSISFGSSTCVVTSSVTALVLLVNTTTNFLQSFDSVAGNTRAISNVIGAGHTTLWCPAAFCAAFNPTSRSFLTFGFGSITVLARTTPISIAALGQPSYLTVVQRSNNGGNMDAFVVIGDTNSVVYVVSFAPGATTAATNRTLMTLTNTAKIVGITAPNANVVIVAFEGGTNLFTYDFNTGVLLGTYGGLFGRVGALHSDFNGRVFATDINAGSVRIYDQNGVQTHVANGFTNPIQITTGRNGFYVLDTPSTIYRVMHENLTVTDFSYQNMTCPSGAYVSVSVAGGGYFYTYNILPDTKNYYGTFFQITQTSATSATMGPIYPRITGYPDYYMYDEGLGGNMSPSGLSSLNSFNPLSTAIPAYEGIYSAEIKVWGRSFVTLSYMSNFLEVSMYSAVELWINPGNGGQNINITTSGLPRPYPAGSFPLNTWTKVTLVLDRTALAASSVTFTDAGASTTNTTNPFYVDNMKSIFSTNPRFVSVTDVCTSITIFGPNFDVYDDQEMKVVYDDTEPSCDADVTNNAKSSDGQITAYVTGGVPPYSYSWSFSSSTTNVTTGLAELNGRVPIYVNGLIPPFTDSSSSFGRIPLDPTYYRSPPYSYSFSPASNTEGMIFESSIPLDGSNYDSISFWINGGPLGGQYLYVQLKNSFQVVGRQVFLHNLAGIYPIPRNTWIQIVYPMRGFNNIPFTSLIIHTPFVSRITPRLYVDDVELVLANVSLTINDSAGCSYRAPPIQLNYPDPIVATPAISYARCYGYNDGRVTLNITGGTPPYSTTWRSSVTSASLSSLNESRVELNVTDSKTCIPTAGTVIADVLQPPKLELLAAMTPPRCYGGRGSINAHLIGGSGTYTYVWFSLTSAPSTTPQPQTVVIFGDSLLSTFTLTDDSGGAIERCLGTGSHLSYSFSPSHSGYCSLQSRASASVGTKVFGFRCNNCMNNTMYSQLKFWILLTRPSDASHLTMVTMSGNTTTASALIFNSNLPSSPSWTYISFNMPEATSDGFYIISTAPTEPMYLDSIILIPVSSNTLVDGKRVNIGFTSIVSGLAGIYTAFVSDDNLCTIDVEFTMPQPEAITITYTADQPGDGNDGSLVVSARGGTPPYTYLWLVGNETGTTLANIGKGEYTVQVTDANGCSIERTIILDGSSGIRTERPFDEKFSNGISALVAAGLVVWVFARGMLFVYRDSFSKHGSFFSSILLVGVLFANGASIDYLVKPTDASCIIFPWLLGVAFVLSFGCLFIKTWTLYKVWRKAINYERSSLTPNYIAKCLGAALAVEIIFLIIWTAVDPPKLRNQNMINNESQMQCGSENAVFWIIFIAYKGAWLVFGTVLAVLTRNVVKEYNESSAIAYAIYNILLLGIIAVPLAILLDSIPGGRVLIIVAVIQIAFTFTTIILFFNIWYKILFSLEDKLTAAAKRSMETKTTAQSSGGSGRSSKGSAQSSKKSSGNSSNSHSSASPPSGNSASVV